MKNFKQFILLLILLAILPEICIQNKYIYRVKKSKSKSTKSNNSLKPNSIEIIYDSELNPDKPFKYKKETSKYQINKKNIILLNKNIKDDKLKGHIWDLLKVISIYSLVNDNKVSIFPRYLKLASKHLNSRLLVEKIDAMIKLPLFKTGFNKYLKNMYTINKGDKARAKKVNIFDTTKKRKDRLEELEDNLNKSLKRNKNRLDDANKKITLDRGLKNENGISIENFLMNHNKVYKVQKAPVERFLKVIKHKRKPKLSKKHHQKIWKKKTRFRKLNKKNLKKSHHRHKLKQTRNLTTRLINPVHHHHRKAFAIPGAPGGGGGVTQGPGVENLKVVINAIGQPSTYLPVEQNDSYKKGYKETDAEPKVIVTRMKLPGRLG